MVIVRYLIEIPSRRKELWTVTEILPPSFLLAPSHSVEGTFPQRAKEHAMQSAMKHVINYVIDRAVDRQLCLSYNYVAFF